MATRIETEGERVLTVGQQLGLLQSAFAAAPSPVVRDQLATMLFLDDRFDDVIALLEDADGRSFREEMMLAQACLALERPEYTVLARAAAERAFGLAANDSGRAAALADRGKCEKRLGDVGKAFSTLGQALALDPHNKDVCKRLAAIELEAGRPEALLALTDNLLGRGVGHARLFGARVLALAKAGDMHAAHEAEGFDRLHSREQLAPPEGFDSIAAFNMALAGELLAHPGMRFERYGSASELSWRIENPARPDTPLFRALIAQISEALGGHIVRAKASGHAWAGFAPDSALLRNWCVITESTGFESWHVHQFGWLSGVYYVRVPESIARGTDRGGCLAFGLPDELAGAEAAARFGEHLVRPREGMLLSFPSHVYHRTYPHGSGEKRICVAFDLRPV